MFTTMETLLAGQYPENWIRQTEAAIDPIAELLCTKQPVAPPKPKLSNVLPTHSVEVQPGHCPRQLTQNHVSDCMQNMTDSQLRKIPKKKPHNNKSIRLHVVFVTRLTGAEMTSLLPRKICTDKQYQ